METECGWGSSLCLIQPVQFPAMMAPEFPWERRQGDGAPAAAKSRQDDGLREEKTALKRQLHHHVLGLAKINASRLCCWPFAYAILAQTTRQALRKTEAGSRR